MTLLSASSRRSGSRTHRDRDDQARELTPLATTIEQDSELTAAESTTSAKARVVITAAAIAVVIRREKDPRAPLFDLFDGPPGKRPRRIA